MFLASGTFQFCFDGLPSLAPMLTDAGANGICFCSVLIIAFHFTNHVCCQVIGLRITSRPLFCRNIDVTRLLGRKLGFPHQDPVRSHHQLPVSFSIFRRANGDVSRLFTEHQRPGPICVLSHMDVVEVNTCQCNQRSWSLSWRRTSEPPPATHARPQARKRFVSDSVTFGIIGVRFVQHRALPSPRLTPFFSSTKSTPSSRGISSGTSSGRVASLEEQDVHTAQASRWLVEPCRCLGPLSRTNEHPLSTVSETEK